MKWEIAPRTRLDIVGFEGLNCAGERHVVNIHAVGGRQGDLPATIKSLAISGMPGVRVILMTQGPDVPLTEQTWRCVRLTAKRSFRNKEGAPTVRIPDLDLYDEPDARRSDTELQSGYEQVSGMGESREWTFGRTGRRALKGNVAFIRVEPDLPPKAADPAPVEAAPVEPPAEAPAEPAQARPAPEPVLEPAPAAPAEIQAEAAPAVPADEPRAASPTLVPGAGVGAPAKAPRRKK